MMDNFKQPSTIALPVYELPDNREQGQKDQTLNKQGWPIQRRIKEVVLPFGSFSSWILLAIFGIFVLTYRKAERFNSWIWPAIFGIFVSTAQMYPWRKTKVAIHDRWATQMTDDFITSLTDYLAEHSVQVEKHSDCESSKCPLVVLCLHESRIAADEDSALSEIDEEDMQRVILIILHWKVSDIDARKGQCEKRVREVIDCFLQPSLDNLQDVLEQILNLLK